MPMYFGGTGSASASSSSSYNSGTDTLSGNALNPDGSPATSRTVKVYLDGSGTAAFTTTTDSSGNWSVSSVGMANGLAHSWSVSVDLSSSTNSSGGYTPAYKRTRFDGTTYALITSGGIILSADIPTITPVLSGSTITGFSFGSGSGGANYEPGVVQTITKASGAGSGMTATVAARTDGKLYDADVVVTAAGTGYTSGSVFQVTRKCQRFLVAASFRSETGTVSGDGVISYSNGLALAMTSNVGVRLSCSAVVTGPILTGSASALNTYLFSVDLTKAAASGGWLAYQNGAAVSTAPSTFAQGYAGIDFSALGTVGAAVMSKTGGTNIMEGDVDFLYFAAGYLALDSVTGALPDLTQQTVRDRFLSGNINLTDGSGATGRRPQGFWTGPAAGVLANKGRSVAYTQTGTGVVDI